jgi:hypothetical protein
VHQGAYVTLKNVSNPALNGTFKVYDAADETHLTLYAVPPTWPLPADITAISNSGTAGGAASGRGMYSAGFVNHSTWYEPYTEGEPPSDLAGSNMVIGGSNAAGFTNYSPLSIMTSGNFGHQHTIGGLQDRAASLDIIAGDGTNDQQATLQFWNKKISQFSPLWRWQMVSGSYGMNLYDANSALRLAFWAASNGRTDVSAAAAGKLTLNAWGGTGGIEAYLQGASFGFYNNANALVASVSNTGVGTFSSIAGGAAGQFAAASHTHAAADVTSGVLALARMIAAPTASRCVRINDAGTSFEVAGADCGSSGSSYSNLVQIDANTLAERNGTNAQSLHIYGQYTSGSNFNRLGIRWLNNDVANHVIQIVPEDVGNGYDAIEIGAVADTNVASRGAWQFMKYDDGRHFIAVTDNTYDIGYNSSSYRPRNIYAGTSMAAPKFCYSGTSICDYAGSGSPEGVVTAAVGSTYRRSDGGMLTSFYVKESGSGNTGWVGK